MSMRAVIDVNNIGQNQLTSISTSSSRMLLTEIGELASTSEQGVVVHTTSAEAFENLSCDSILEMIASETPLSISAIEIPSSLSSSISGNTTQSIMFSALLAAMANGEEINIQSVNNSDKTISAAERGEIIRIALKILNVEDLYPNHPWSTHEEESLAASYHTISALFIRIGDLDGALEVLALSDRFEDSPRSLALRGMISRKRGETLDAVANMVSSLQQYEKRKQEAEGSHYLSFNPTSFEEINAELKDGLEALNKRDNENALAHFAQAVFQFDGFYKQYGIDKMS